MAYKFFTVPLHNSQAEETELNGFLASHKVLSVDRRWVEQGTSSFWAFCVDYLASAGTTPTPTNRKPKVDYKEILSPAEFPIFAKLRELRKDIAQSAAVPVYTIFTNEQLAQMVQTRAKSKADLEKIAGVGDGRIEKYGERVLEFLKTQWTDQHETSGASV